MAGSQNPRIAMKKKLNRDNWLKVDTSKFDNVLKINLPKQRDFQGKLSTGRTFMTQYESVASYKEKQKQQQKNEKKRANSSFDNSATINRVFGRDTNTKIRSSTAMDNSKDRESRPTSSSNDDSSH